MRSWQLRLFIVAALLLPVAAVPPAAQAQGSYTINVNTLVDEWSTDPATAPQSKCSLREAIQATATGNPNGNQGCGGPAISGYASYTFAMKSGTHKLTIPEELPHVTKPILIDGGGNLTIDGGRLAGRAYGIFNVAAGGLTLKRLKLQHGWRPFGGAILHRGGSLRLEQVELFRNKADNGFGSGDGGAVAVDGGTFACVKSKFLENEARSAGGAVSSGNIGAQIDECEFYRNFAGLNGGAYAVFGGSGETHTTIRDSKFRENWVYQITPPSPYDYSDQAGGGAIYNQGFLVLERAQLWKNYTRRAKGGGAIYNQGVLHLLDVAISDNQAKLEAPADKAMGGGILNDSTLVARRVSLHYNEAYRGGAIMNRTSGLLYLVNSTVAENTATAVGGVSNGYSIVADPYQGVVDNGGTAHLWHATVVRNGEGGSFDNIASFGTGSLYMANSVLDSRCDSQVYSHGGNVYRQFCQTLPPDINDNQLGTDFAAPNVAAVGIEGLADNGGASLPEAQFLSVKVTGDSPAVDLGRDAYCTDPGFEPLFLIGIDQIQGQRPQGQFCDAGAVEVGSQGPRWYSSPANGLLFPMVWTTLDPSSEKQLLIQNKGGGSISWSLSFEVNPDGMFSLTDGPASGGLGKDQAATLTLRCTPNTLGDHRGVLLITTDLPGHEQVRFPLACKKMVDPTQPGAFPEPAPGPLSLGQAAPGGSAGGQVVVGNPSNSPLDATVSLEDALASTIQVGTSLAALAAPDPFAPAATPQAVTVPPGGQLTITITCTPPGPGLFTNTLHIASNDPITPLQSYSLSCEGALPPDPEPLGASTLWQEGTPQRIMGLAISPDGAQILAGHWDDTGVARYSRNPASGALTLQGSFSRPGMGTVTGIRYSADGKHVYYTSSAGDGLVVASRDGAGALSWTQTITSGSELRRCPNLPLFFCPLDTMDGARALALSPDDLNVYVTGISDDTLTVFRRNPTTGALSYAQTITGTLDGAPLMDGPFGVVASPDGRNVYVAAFSGDTVLAFSRQGSNGRLSYLTHVANGGAVGGLDGPVELAISPDGRFLYAASYGSDAVQIFARNPADGFITPLEAVAVGDGPYHLLVSNDPDGARLVVAVWTGDAIKAFKRDRADGTLTPLAGQSSLTPNGPVFLVSTPDDRDLYAALYDGQGVQRLRALRHDPLVQALAPASVVAGSGELTLTVRGQRFYPDTEVLWNGSALATTYVGPNRLDAVVPAALTASVEQAQVYVRTSPPGGGESEALTLAIIAPGTPPTPAVSGISPEEVPAGGAPVSLVVTGAGFTPASQALLNGLPVATVYLNETTLLVELAADQVDAPGPLALSVVNQATAGAAALQAGGAASATALFAVAAPGSPALPALGGFSPASLPAGSDEQWLTVLGHSFSQLPGAATVAYWGGEARETIVLDAGRLQLRVTAEDLAAAGSPVVTAYTPGAGTALGLAFPVLAPGQNPVARPEVVAVELGASPRIVVSGADFVAGAELRLNGVALPTTLVSDVVLTAQVTRAALAQGGLVQVANPGTALAGPLVLAPLAQSYAPMLRR